MKNSKLTLNHNQIWGTVLVATSLLIFLSSLVITLGNSISDGTLWVCVPLLFFGTVLLVNGASEQDVNLKETQQWSLIFWRRQFANDATLHHLLRKFTCVMMNHTMGSSSTRMLQVSLFFWLLLFHFWWLLCLVRAVRMDELVWITPQLCFAHVVGRLAAGRLLKCIVNNQTRSRIL